VGHCGRACGPLVVERTQSARAARPYRVVEPHNRLVVRALQQPIDPEQESQQRLELENRSRIVALPGTAETLHGYSAPKLVLIDEPQHLPDDTYQPCDRRRTTDRGGDGRRLPRLVLPGIRARRPLLASLADHRRSLLAHLPQLPGAGTALPDRVFRAEYLCQWFDTELPERQQVRAAGRNRRLHDPRFLGGEGHFCESMQGDVTRAVLRQSCGSRLSRAARAAAHGRERIRPGTGRPDAMA
jgi:hypothetical protein